MPIDKHSVAAFQARQNEIVACDPALQPAMAHDVAVWRAALAVGTPARTVLETCIELCGGTLTLSRQTLLDAVAAGVDPQARFLMQMLWGYRPSDGRAKVRVRDYFASPIISDPQQYGQVAADLHSGHLQRAFCRLMEVQGLSTSFVTKVLYFETRHKHAPYALILDDRAATGLVKITSPWADDCVTVSAPRPLIGATTGARAKRNALNETWTRYWKYVEGCHAIAAACQTEADHVEIFLFNA